ncbi:hypothetical protein [Aquimarina mytili]|uniref:Uncharacterized protein n=1 Tax=Aquimarina mytili TaxID=874423 RepID=A0A937A0N0_9FLAO|nr:hypothetical protein [Aquimarina mytili]MBL0685418.1 hypothetical protein [Aquimarina mytili]
MKTLKIFLILFLILAFTFAGLSFLTLNFFEKGSNAAGGDYLGGFWILVMFIGVFLICMIASISIGSIVFLKHTSNFIRFIVAALFSILTVYFVLVFTFLPSIRFW